jgi:hypothetical protein
MNKAKSKQQKNKYRITWNFTGLEISLDNPDRGLNLIECRNKDEIAKLAVKALRETADRIESDRYLSSSLGRVLRRVRTYEIGKTERCIESHTKYGEYEETIL